jgi:hypothetical protein
MRCGAARDVGWGARRRVSGWRVGAGGVLVAYAPTEEEEPFGVRHPELFDHAQVTLQWRAAADEAEAAAWRDPALAERGPEWCGGEGAAEETRWVTIGSGELPVGVEDALTSHAVAGRRFSVTVSGEHTESAAGGEVPGVPQGATIAYSVRLPTPRPTVLPTAPRAAASPRSPNGTFRQPHPAARTGAQVLLHDWNTVTDKFLDGSLVVAAYGQPEDPYSAVCRDCAQVDIALRGWTTPATRAEDALAREPDAEPVSFLDVNLDGRSIPEVPAPPRSVPGRVPLRTDAGGVVQAVQDAISAVRDGSAAGSEDAARILKGMAADDDSVFHPRITIRNVTVGSRHLPEALEQALGLVRKGQRAQVFVAPSRCEDDVWRHPWGESLRNHTVWELEVLQLRRPHLLPPLERIEAARVRKEWGNDLFHAGFFEQALEKYRLAEVSPSPRSSFSARSDVDVQ